MSSETCSGSSSSSSTATCSSLAQRLPPHVSTDVLLGVLITSAVVFAAVFFGSWQLFQKYWDVHFTPMHKPVKADSVARVGSSIHALIVVPMLLYYLATAKFNPDSMEPENIPENIFPYKLVQISFAITCGYFITDGFLTYGFKMPLWQAFLAHHIFAATPYMTFLFVLPCSVGSFILAGFMIVETTNITLNTQVLLERSGKSDTWLYAACLYTTIVMWSITRIGGPLYMIYTLHAHALPSLPDDTKKCLYFSIGCAYFIVVFCAYGFVFVLLKEVVLRWKSNPEPGKVAQLDADTRVLKAGSSMNLSEDEVAVSADSPTHVSLYEARRGFREVESKIEGVIDRCLHNINSNSNKHHVASIRSNSGSDAEIIDSANNVAGNNNNNNSNSKKQPKRNCYKKRGGVSAANENDDAAADEHELAPLNLNGEHENSDDCCEGGNSVSSPSSRSSGSGDPARRKLGGSPPVQQHIHHQRDNSLEYGAEACGGVAHHHHHHRVGSTASSTLAQHNHSPSTMRVHIGSSTMSLDSPVTSRSGSATSFLFEESAVSNNVTIAPAAAPPGGGGGGGAAAAATEGTTTRRTSTVVRNSAEMRKRA